jgi:two-component system LytT family response regulator
LRRLSIRTGGRTLVLRASEVVWIQAEDCCVRVHSKRGRHLLRASLSSLEQQLDPGRFLRVHRTAIVNLDEVEELQPLASGACLLVLSDGSRLAVSRSRKPQVEQALRPRARSSC